jgi:hypothetical protein
MKNPFFILKIWSKILWNDFYLSLQKRWMKFFYIITFITIIIISLLFYLLFPIISNNYLQIFSRYTLLDILELLSYFFNIWIIYNILQGLFFINLTKLFGVADIVLFSFPIKYSTLFFTKYTQKVFKHLLYLFILLLFIIPTTIFNNLNTFQIINIFFIFFVLFEIGYIIKYLIFFMKRIILKPNNKQFLLFTLLLIVIFYLIFDNIIVLNKIYEFLPSSIAIRLIIFNNLKLYNNSYIILSSIFVFYYLSIIILSVYLCINYYEDVIIKTKSMDLKSSFIVGKIPWNIIARANLFSLIAFNDFFIYLRENLSNFFKILFFGLILGIFNLNIGSNYFSLYDFNISQNELVSIINFLIIISLIIISPFPFSIIKDFRQLWILRVSPISTRNIIYGKLFYGIIISVIFSFPIIFSLLLYLNSPINYIKTIGISLIVILLSNSVGLMIGILFRSYLIDFPYTPMIADLVYWIIILSYTIPLMISNIFPIISVYIFTVLFISFTLTPIEPPFKNYIFYFLMNVFILGGYILIIFSIMLSISEISAFISLIILIFISMFQGVNNILNYTIKSLDKWETTSETAKI